MVLGWTGNLNGRTHGRFQIGRFLAYSLYFVTRIIAREGGPQRLNYLCNGHLPRTPSVKGLSLVTELAVVPKNPHCYSATSAHVTLRWSVCCVATRIALVGPLYLCKEAPSCTLSLHTFTYYIALSIQYSETIDALFRQRPPASYVLGYLTVTHTLLIRQPPLH